MELENKFKKEEQIINSNDNRGFLMPNDRALEYLRKQFVMSCIAQGRLGNLFQVHNYIVKGTDKEYTYDEPVQVAYHLDSTPSRKILIKYGWFTEEQEALPTILYLTYYDINNKPVRIDEGAKLEISGKNTIKPNDIITETYQITDVHTDLELNQAVCKVVPVREDLTENVKVLETKEDPNNENKYLNREIYYLNDEEEFDENSFIKRGE